MGSYKWVISKVSIVITHIGGLITILITTHEPPSSLDVEALGARLARLSWGGGEKKNFCKGFKALSLLDGHFGKFYMGPDGSKEA